jgi:hypothetical protein
MNGGDIIGLMYLGSSYVMFSNFSPDHAPAPSARTRCGWRSGHPDGGSVSIASIIATRFSRRAEFGSRQHPSVPAITSRIEKFSEQNAQCPTYCS